MANFISKVTFGRSSIDASPEPVADEKLQAEISVSELSPHDQTIGERDQAITEHNQAVRGRDQAIQVVKERDEAKHECDEAVQDCAEARKVPAAARLERDEGIRTRDQMISNQNLHIERQVDEIKTLANIIKGTNAVVLSQIEKIQSLDSQLASEKSSRHLELHKLQKKHREEKKKYMPCFQVGHMVREYNMNPKGVLPQDLDEATWRGSRICNCSKHQGRPLADATMILFDYQLRPHQVQDVFHRNFEESYCVPVQFAFDNYDFKKFQALLRMHEDMCQFGREGTTPKEVADQCVSELKELISKIYPQGIYEKDLDILLDPEASATDRLTQEHTLAVAKHQAFCLENYRLNMNIELPFNLLDIIENDARATPPQ